MTTVQAVLFKLHNGKPPSEKYVKSILKQHDWHPIKEGHLTDQYL